MDIINDGISLNDALKDSEAYCNLLINKNIEPRLNTKKKMDLYEVDANFMIDPLPKKKTKEFTQKEKTEFFAIKKAERIYYNELLLSNKNNDDYKIDFEKIKAEYYYDRKYKDNLILYMKKNFHLMGTNSLTLFFLMKKILRKRIIISH